MANLVRIEPSLFRADEVWFVFDDGRKCLRKTTPPEVPARSDFPCPMIRRDSIDPCFGMDGRMHDSMASYRRTLRPDGNPQGERYIELGNESLPHVEQKIDRQQRRDDIKAAIQDVKYGRVPPTPTSIEP
ncbi:hypothetical protein [Rhizorhapis suberifaciens]|uniref:Uncharacterized protein n=1 Tax=Rhizorhapis suberifaciens TaxID=13656 RepID=A0A840HYA1_9SPHN|nr:hypothetical protein [Rhizorhapis suberifaciens]MBB4642364.1 hypothetical protein [Rhizorhapis suberifaciens]